MIDTYVYFIQAGNAVKIGIASDVERRIVDLQVGNPHKIELIHTIHVSRQDALMLESKLHRVFYKTRLVGEWFQLNQYMLSFISNIKLNGWQSYPDWLSSQYKEAYADILQSFEKQLDLDAIRGDTVSLEKLKRDLERLLNVPLMPPEVSASTHQSIRKWVEDRENDSFGIRDIYKDFGIQTKGPKKNVSTILSRLCREGLIEPSDSFGRFSKIMMQA